MLRDELNVYMRLSLGVYMCGCVKSTKRRGFYILVCVSSSKYPYFYSVTYHPLSGGFYMAMAGKLCINYIY